MAAIELDRVSVVTDGRRRLDEFSLSIDDGQFVGIVGSSGSGKTTLLRTIAGLERVSSGAIRFDGVDVTHAPPASRDVSFVFQSAALFPHLDARRNVSFPLDVQHRDQNDVRLRVDAEARALHIEQLMHRKPHELSHGEQHVVQIGRALVRMPTTLLLDEPFATLDEPLRHRLRAEIRVLQEGYGVTTVMTTNDPLDVLGLARRVAVIEEGRLVQYGATPDVRRSPATVAAAAATGALSLIDMTVVADRTGYWLLREDPGGGETVRHRAWSPRLHDHVGAPVTVAVRPEDVVISATGTVPARVQRRLPVPAGSVQCLVAGALVTATAPPALSLAPGDAVRLRLDHVSVFDRVTHIAIT